MEYQTLALAAIFSDHMVLQRDKPIRIWGYCPADDKITVTLGSEQVAASIENGRWIAYLPPIGAAVHLEMIVRSSSGEQIEISDVAIGEVWVAGGQSNMEFLLKFDQEAAKSLPGTNNAYIRYFETPKITVIGEEIGGGAELFGVWRDCTPSNAANFSAVGFYFMQRLFESLQVPIGIIGCTWSGTSAAAWLSEEYLRRDADLNVYLEEYQEAIKDLDLSDYEQQVKSNRQLFLLPSNVVVFDKMNAGTATEEDIKMIAPLMELPFIKQIGPMHFNRPNGLYQTMVKEIRGYTARGVIWYQGEADIYKAPLYDKLFTALIECWREEWEEELPFLFVQLAPFRDHVGNGKGFPLIRFQQEKVSKTVQKAYMASIMDAGMEFDIHPKRKRPVGERLALLALGKVYEQDILCEAPEVEQVTREGNNVRIAFQNAGEGLAVRGEKLNGLQVIAGERLIPFHTVVEGNKLVVILEEAISDWENIDIRFACSAYEEVNLYSSASLPAKPFRYKLGY